MKHVRWTPDEWKLLASMWREQVEAGLSKKQALVYAQSKFPQGRQRSITNAIPVYDRLIVLAGEPVLRVPEGDTRAMVVALKGKVEWLESEINTLKARLNIQNGAPKKHDPTPPPNTHVRKPKIAVIGIRPNQAAEIHHYEKHFELRYYEPSAHNYDWCAHATRVILMGSHVTYTQQQTLKRLGVHLLYNQSGAVSGLIPLLDNLKKILHA